MALRFILLRLSARSPLAPCLESSDVIVSLTWPMLMVIGTTSGRATKAGLQEYEEAYF